MIGLPWRVMAGPLLLLACHSNVAPPEPILTGPNKAWPDDTLRFRAASVDRNADQISYQFEWSDGTDTAWSQWLPPAADYYVNHVFAAVGGFPVLCRARDATHESGWSDTLTVQVAEYGPNVPRKPVGRDTAPVGHPYNYVTSTSHPLLKQVSFRYDWGDTVGEWSEFRASGSIDTAQHTFYRAGVFAVRAQAKDVREHISEWSSAETVLVFDTFAIKAGGCESQ